ncbi:uncharacterized protein LOC131674937 [Phymastichus coffea]|uniref:uncharacterized protein LOC131674937 n=1 Tax=Phymastichus coffea TaxID=108790 RepID=UPI00273B91B2|nr:uncharacterized protein LOC131674937 [Phymastichus coffea]
MATQSGEPSNQETQSASKTQVHQSYAKVTSSSIMPKKDQAIVIDSIEGCTIEDYIDGLEALIDASYIKYISKISGNRVCTYLSDNALVEKLTNKMVQVKDFTLKIRPLLEKNKRVVLSNACPVIPNEVFIEALKNKGITIVSQMNNIRAGLNKPGRSHILSFRRQVYIKEEDEHLLPQSLQITYEETQYWVYLSTESAHCFVCKQYGHIAKVCPHASLTQANNTTINNARNQENAELAQNQHILHDSHSEQQMDIENQIRGQKRPPPSSITSDATSGTQTTPPENSMPTLQEIAAQNTFKKPEHKKTKKSNETVSIETALAPAKEALDGQELIINFDQMKLFLEKCRGQPKINNIAKEFTHDIKGLIDTIDMIYPQLSNSNLKSRLTRIKKKLSLPSEELTDSPQESDY